MGVRTSHRDGGGAYFLLDGSREISGHPTPATHNTYNLGTLAKQWGVGYIRACKFITIQSVGSVTYIKTKDNSAAAAIRLQTSAGAAAITAIELTGGLAEFIRVAGNNLPGADPGGGTGQIWSNGGVLTVGT